MPKIIVYGNPVDGLQFVGPFPDGEEIGEEFSERLDEWWIAALDLPAGYESPAPTERFADNPDSVKLPTPGPVTGPEGHAPWLAEILGTEPADEPTPERKPPEPNWVYPLYATCRVCGEHLQFDIGPNGTPGRNGDWGADGDYGCITGNDEGSDGHTPTNIRWEPKG